MLRFRRSDFFYIQFSSKKAIYQFKELPLSMTELEN